MSAVNAATDREVWERTIRPEVADLSAGAARELLRLRLSEADVTRVRELSEKANAGALSAQEAEEIDYYLSVGRALEFLKAKARLSLRDCPVSA
jgi:hypothetical protein